MVDEAEEQRKWEDLLMEALLTDDETEKERLLNLAMEMDIARMERESQIQPSEHGANHAG